MTLSCVGVTKFYAGRAVLRDCNVRVDPGACVIIRGRSGGGKSTLLRILALLEAPDEGIVWHGSKRIERPAPRPGYPAGAYPFLTLVFQQLFLWPNMTMAENVSFTIYGDRKKTLLPEHMGVLEELEIGDSLGQKPHECSLGQRQRVAIGRALLSDTKFLLLDEPTSALDPRNRDTVACFLESAKKEGRGLLIVSHDERDFEQISDEVLDLEDGRLRPSQRSR